MTSTGISPAVRVPGESRGDEPVAVRRRSIARRLAGGGEPDRWWGWLTILIITAIGGILRFWHLGRPPYLVFDETYYVKWADSMWRYGYERATALKNDEADKLWNAGNHDVWSDKADFVVHPPLGKWLIGIGEHLFGVGDSFGWRFVSAVLGTLSILMLGRIARRMFRSNLIGATAALLLAVDGQHFVHSRTGLLDIQVMFWALAAFGALVIDRDVGRARLATRTAGQIDGAPGLLANFGPGLGIRWWRLVAAVCLGACCGTKWSGIWFVAVFGLMTVFWDIGARRATGARRWLSTGLFRDGASAALTMLPVTVIVYLMTWTGWFLSKDGYDRTWAGDHPAAGLGRLVPDALRSLWFYHSQMWTANVNLKPGHSFESHPYSWIVVGRPVLFDWRSYEQGQNGCTLASKCEIAIIDLGNPLIWWGATLALPVALAMWMLARDWRVGAALAGVAAGWCPWFLFSERTIFDFYAVAFVPYVVLIDVYMLAMILGPPGASPRRRRIGGMVAGGLVTLTVALFVWFHPILSDQLISPMNLQDRIWIPTWR